MATVTDVSRRVWENVDFLPLDNLKDGDRVVIMTEDYSLYFITADPKKIPHGSTILLRKIPECRPDLGLRVYLQNMGDFGWPGNGFARTLLRFFRDWDILRPGDAFQHEDLDNQQWYNAEPIREMWLSRALEPTPAA